MRLKTGYLKVIWGTSVVGVVNVSNTNFETFLWMLMLHEYMLRPSEDTIEEHFPGLNNQGSLSTKMFCDIQLYFFGGGEAFVKHVGRVT
jgi:hypothetical protein